VAEVDSNKGADGEAAPGGSGAVVIEVGDVVSCSAGSGIERLLVNIQ
jgi:hypothetical protein